MMLKKTKEWGVESEGPRSGCRMEMGLSPYLGWPVLVGGRSTDCTRILRDVSALMLT